MTPPDTTTSTGRWTSLWIVAVISLLGQLAICQFFSFGVYVPESIDMNPSNLWKLAYHFPPTSLFLVLNWFGVPNLPTALNPFSLAAATWPTWLFFTAYAPLIGFCSLLAMAAFLRELELSRPAALFGGVVFAWQGDILPFVLPGHFAYITFWPFFAVAAWSTLRAQRTGHWAYALLSGAACGTMLGLPTTADRGALASLFIAFLYLAPVIFSQPCRVGTHFLHLGICAVTAFLISIAPLLAIFQSQISNVKVGGHSHFEEIYKFCTQFSLGPLETFTFLVPGFFGWHSNSDVGPYWGLIGQTPGWPDKHEGMRNLNLAISTIGTTASVLALIGAFILLPFAWLGRAQISTRSQFYARTLLGLGAVALVLSWGYHTSFYRPLFALPFMDKWRNPLKWLELTNFSLVALSALGVHHLIATFTSESPEQKTTQRQLFRFSLIALALLLLAYLVSHLFTIYLAPELAAESYQPGEIKDIINTIYSSLRMACLLMVLFCVLLYAMGRPEKLRTWTLINPFLNRVWHLMLLPTNLALTLALSLALLSVVQLAWVTSHFIEPRSFTSLTVTNALIDALKAEGSQVRVSVAVEDPVLSILLQNQFNATDISSVDISAASRIPDDLNAFFRALGSDRQRLWFLAGVKNVAIPQEFMPQLRADPLVAANIDHADGYTLVDVNPDLPSHAIVGLRDYLSKATLVPIAEFLSPEDILKRLDNRDWNPRATVLLDPSLKKLSPPAEAGAKPSAKNTVEVTTYNPTQIAIHVQSTTGGYVLINDQYDPDWQVQVNGHAADLLRADYLLRAVEVPPGESFITMRYVAHYHIAGFNLSVRRTHLFSDAVMLAAWITAFVALRRRRDAIPANPPAPIPAP
jgi:hypothetical protein